MSATPTHIPAGASQPVELHAGVPLVFCGVPPEQLAEAARGVYRWQNRRALTWFWVDRIAGVAADDQLADTEWCFEQWSLASNRYLTFSRAVSRQTADIVLTSRVIDGPAGVLAEMQLPPGDDRQLVGWFDTREAWDKSVRLRLVLLHELGHAMGLGHIKGQTAVLNPVYNPNLPALQPADIQSLLQIYPEAVNHVPPTTPKPPSPDPSAPVDPVIQLTINVPASLPAGTYQAYLTKLL